MKSKTNRKTGLLSTAARMRRGASGTEIGLLLGLIAVVSIASVSLLGVRISDLNNTLAGSIEDAGNTTGGAIGSGGGTGGGSGSGGGPPAVDAADPTNCDGGTAEVDGDDYGTAGDDSYEIDGSISGGVNLDDGNDTLSVCGGADVVDLGNGTDSLTVGGTVLGVDFGDGEGVVNIGGNVDGRIDSSNDDGTPKTVVVEGSVNDEIDMGGGDDDITIGGDAAANVNLQGGTDSLDIRGNANGQINADQGGGDTTVRVLGNVDEEINLGDADDTVEVGGDTADVTLKAGANTLDVGGSILGSVTADDNSFGTSVTVGVDITGVADLSDGDDSLIVVGNAGDINTEKGSDTVEVTGSVNGFLRADDNGSGGSFTVGGNVAGETDLTDGNDTLSVDGNTGAINTEKGSDTVDVGGKVTGLIEQDDDGAGIALTVGNGVDGRLDLSHGNDTVTITGDVIYSGSSNSAINSEQGSDSITVTGSVLGGKIEADDDGGGASYDIGGNVDGNVDLSDGNDTLIIGGDMTGGVLNTEKGVDSVTVQGDVIANVEQDDDGGGLELEIGGNFTGDLDGSDAPDRFIIAGTYSAGTFNGEQEDDTLWLKSYSQSDWDADVDNIRTSLNSVENVKAGNDIVRGDASAFSHGFFN